MSYGEKILVLAVVNDHAWFRLLGCKLRRSSFQDNITYTIQTWQRLPKADFLDNEPPTFCDQGLNPTGGSGAWLIRGLEALRVPLEVTQRMRRSPHRVLNH